MNEVGPVSRAERAERRVKGLEVAMWKAIQPLRGIKGAGPTIIAQVRKTLLDALIEGTD